MAETFQYTTVNFLQKLQIDFRISKDKNFYWKK